VIAIALFRLGIAWAKALTRAAENGMVRSSLGARHAKPHHAAGRHEPIVDGR
jgi:hypothetical protein